MKEIKLTRGYVAIVDDDDYEIVNALKWCVIGKKKIYAMRKSSKFGRTVLMHRFILGVLDNKEIEIDHKNGDTLDNRKINIRFCTRTQNSHNAKKRSNTISKYKGLEYRDNLNLKKKWRVRIVHNGIKIHIGYFLTEIEAAKAYDQAAIKYFGEFARLNFPQNTEY